MHKLKITYILPSAKHRFWHRFKLVYFNGITKFYKCKKCSTRKIVQSKKQEMINWDWLYFTGGY